MIRKDFSKKNQTKKVNLKSVFILPCEKRLFYSSKQKVLKGELTKML